MLIALLIGYLARSGKLSAIQHRLARNQHYQLLQSFFNG